MRSTAGRWWWSWCGFLALGVVGCGGGTSGSLGTVALSDAETGALVIVDVSRVSPQSIPSSIAAPGAISISPDGTEVAFSAEPVLFARHVLVADVETGAVREVLPETGQAMAMFRWGVGGWFYYWAYAGGVSHYLVVTPGATTGRIVGEMEVKRLIASPTEPRFAYTECTAPPTTGPCPMRLVVEKVNGTDAQVLVDADAIVILGFTPDGGSLVTYEGANLMVRNLATGAAVDLGPADDQLATWAPLRGVSLISPDATEVLTIRSGALVALRLDGTGERTILSEGPESAGFTAAGDVIYVIEINLNPGSDVVETSYNLWIDDGGTQRAIREDSRSCWPAFASSTGAYVAWQCQDGVTVFSLPDGAEVTTGPPGQVFGFDRSDRGFVVGRYATEEPADYTVQFVDVVRGTEALLGIAAYQDTPNGRVEWPPFDYAP